MNYLYRVRDTKGRVKTGVMQAVSRQAVIERFESDGWRIEEVRAEPAALPESPPTATHKAPPGSGEVVKTAPKPPAAVPKIRRARPPLRQPGRFLKLLASALIASGLAWGLIDSSHAPAVSTPRQRPWKLRIEGKGADPRLQRYHRVRFSFPEIPLQLDRTPKQLAGNGDTFSLEESLISVHQPTYCEVRCDEGPSQRVNCAVQGEEVRVQVPDFQY